jgi:hypothetical protein
LKIARRGLIIKKSRTVLARDFFVPGGKMILSHFIAATESPERQKITFLSAVLLPQSKLKLPMPSEAPPLPKPIAMRFTNPEKK